MNFNSSSLVKIPGCWGSSPLFYSIIYWFSKYLVLTPMQIVSYKMLNTGVKVNTRTWEWRENEALKKWKEKKQEEY